MLQNEQEIRLAVITPTYNNAPTLGGVVKSILALNLPLIVINDGSTDGTCDVLAEFGNRVSVLTHHYNMGKAAAMRTGFEHARSSGFTHVLTIDTDGQHDIADVPRLNALARSNPDALILGTRDTTAKNYPPASLTGRIWSNRFVAIESGLRVSDSQCGMRIYPLNVAMLPARSARYGFETEILTRCGWAHVPVIEAPIRCIYSDGRVSHFRPWVDTLRGMGMHARLLARSFLPIRPQRLHTPDDHTQTGTIFERLVRWFSPLRAWRAIRNDPDERKRFAIAISVGVFIANLPVYGFQGILSLLTARRCRLNPLAVLTGAHLSTPPVGAFLIALAILVGHWIQSGTWLQISDLDPSRIGYMNLLRTTAVDWILGSLVCGSIMAFLTYVIVQSILFLIPTIQPAPTEQATQA